MSHVDLCSGIGGFALGFEWAGLSKPVLFCDIEPWSRKVLSKHWPDVPIAHDVKELANDPDRFIPRTDPRNTILTSGYPCQPFSVAGKQRGTEDDRHIWPFISQIIAHKRPAFCVLENVYGHVALGLDEVLADLEAQDYATRAFIVPACVSMPRTDEIESGLLHTPTATANQMAPSMRSRDAGSWWATPNTMDHLPQRSAESMDKMKQGARKGRARPSNLREQVNPDTMQMWATPRTTDAAGGARPMDEKGRRISYSSNLVFGANLSDQVRMWPTPTASQARSEGSIKQMRQKVYAGEVTREEAEAMIGGSLEPARLSAMWPTPMARDYKDTPTQTDRGLGSRDDSKLPIRVFREEEKMWPTPTANEDHAGRPGTKMQKMLGNHPEVRNTGVGTLNPQWVEWLMGYPRGWTDLTDGSESQPISQE
jgi:site-specific DNA-cytosine methylase